MSHVTRTARDLKGMARVTRHHLPQVGVVGSAGTGRDGLRTSARATANPSQPAQFESAPNEMKRAVAAACQMMFWKASSPAIQPQVKLRMVKGSRRIGR